MFLIMCGLWNKNTIMTKWKILGLFSYYVLHKSKVLTSCAFIAFWSSGCSDFNKKKHIKIISFIQFYEHLFQDVKWGFSCKQNYCQVHPRKMIMLWFESLWLYFLARMGYVGGERGQIYPLVCIAGFPFYLYNPPALVYSCLALCLSGTLSLFSLCGLPYWADQLLRLTTTKNHGPATANEVGLCQAWWVSCI